MRYIQYQANNNDCGFVSLKMLLASVSKNKSYLYLKKGSKKANFTFRDLIKIASEHGLTLKAYKDEEKDLSFLVKYPGLLLLNDGLTYNNHLVMVFRLRHGKVYFNDPNVGEVAMREDEFLDKYTGHCLLIDSYDRHDFSMKAPNLVTFSSLIPTFFLQFLSIVFLLVGLSFVRKDEYVFIPLIFITLFSLAELVENWYYIKLLKHFDDTYLVDYMRYSKDRVNDYKEYTSMKLLAYSKNRNIFSSSAFAIATAIVLLINDAMNCFPILLIVCIAVIDYIVSTKIMDKENIAREESLIMNKKTPLNDLGDYLLILNHKTNKIGLNLSFKRCIITFVLLVVAVAMMLINHYVSTNYIIFTFAAYYFFYDQLVKIINAENTHVSYLKAKERFLEIITISKEKEFVV